MVERDERTTLGRQRSRSLDERRCQALEAIAEAMDKIHSEMVAARLSRPR